jgi:hypothetical protein
VGPLSPQPNTLNHEGCAQPRHQESERETTTLAEWTPLSLAFHVRFVNAHRCGLPSSYSLDLVDDGGRRYSFHPTGLIP